MCQSPKAYSDSVPVLNLMLCLSPWTRGHSKVKLKVQMIKKWRIQIKGKSQICFSNLTPLAVSVCQDWGEWMAPFCKALDIVSNNESMSIYKRLKKCKKREERKTCYLYPFFPKFNGLNAFYFSIHWNRKQYGKLNLLTFNVHIF